MNSELASLFLATITSGVVTSLILYLAKSWITERLKQAIAHEYAQKLEAHRAALKSDYDLQLERLRAENTKQLAVEASARSSLSDAYKAAHERRITAIERAWAIMLNVDPAISCRRARTSGALPGNRVGFCAHRMRMTRDTYLRTAAFCLRTSRPA
jgi:hypothetical protein